MGGYESCEQLKEVLHGISKEIEKPYFTEKIDNEMILYIEHNKQWRAFQFEK